jgi:hypothetical protein
MRDPAAILLEVFGVDPAQFKLGCQDSVRDDGTCIPFEEAYAKFGQRQPLNPAKQPAVEVSSASATRNVLLKGMPVLLG